MNYTCGFYLFVGLSTENHRCFSITTVVSELLICITRPNPYELQLSFCNRIGKLL